MSVLKDMSNKVKKSEINTKRDSLDITGTLEKNEFIFNNEKEKELKAKLRETKEKVRIAEPITPGLDTVKPK